MTITSKGGAFHAHATGSIGAMRKYLVKPNRILVS